MLPMRWVLIRAGFIAPTRFFDSPEGLELLASWGLPADGSLRGVGNCILGYAEDVLPEAKPRRDNVFYVR